MKKIVLEHNTVHHLKQKSLSILNNFKHKNNLRFLNYKSTTYIFKNQHQQTSIKLPETKDEQMEKFLYEAH